jgi:sarcosine oxidase subunit alpha
MSEHRIRNHPILAQRPSENIPFTFDGRELTARRGEVISSALFAAGIHVFGHHHRDGGAQSIFCVNGQCSQCTVVADGKPVKSCMAPVRPGMTVESCEGLPVLGDAPAGGEERIVEEFETQVLVVGGGPAGICAAVELGRLGVGVLIVDDKLELGGKLNLQTHNFFGSVDECWAGTRGMDIGTMLVREIERLPSVKVWAGSTVVGAFSDGKFGVAGNGSYRLVKPERILVAAGAREKSLSFPGSDLVGVYGAGAFQTLVNRDLVRAASRLFVIGGGNVGLIGAYHALQAKIDVVGLVEALPACGGYKVHEDKIRRLGVPIWTRHTVLRAEGDERVERVIVAELNDDFDPVPGTERAFDVDTVLIAVGLSPVDEIRVKAEQYGIPTYAAGDANEIAEASAAIFSGKITGRRIARDLGMKVVIPSDWEPMMGVLKSKPGALAEFAPEDRPKDPVYPVIRCVQEIPCNPCIQACPHGLIKMEGSIMALPEFTEACQGCGECVVACPGLAINLVLNDYDESGEKTLLMLPFEFEAERVPFGAEVVTTDLTGERVGKGRVISLREREDQDRRRLLMLEVPAADKLRVAGIRMRDPQEGRPVHREEDDGDPIVCRCERVRRSEIVAQIRAGVRDMNQLKAVARPSMGGCGGKTCTEQVLRLFRAEGIDIAEVTLPSIRPLAQEVHLGDFLGRGEED